MSPVNKAPQNLSRPRGAAGVLFLSCLVVGGAGLALEFSRPQPAFWIAAALGARALVGAGAAIVAVVVAHLARLVLARRLSEESLRADRS